MLETMMSKARWYAKIIAERPSALLLAFFFAVYAIGIFHAYGRTTFSGDELHVVFSVLKFFRDWHFADPYAYAFPTMTILYVPFLALSFITALFLGIISSVSELKELIITRPGVFLPVFRLITVIFSVTCLWLTYHIGMRTMGNKRWALLGAYLLGTSFIFTKISFVAIKWMPQLLVVLVAVLFFLI